MPVCSNPESRPAPELLEGEGWFQDLAHWVEAHEEVQGVTAWTNDYEERILSIMTTYRSAEGSALSFHLWVTKRPPSLSGMRSQISDGIAEAATCEGLPDAQIAALHEEAMKTGKWPLTRNTDGQTKRHGDGS